MRKLTFAFAILVAVACGDSEETSSTSSGGSGGSGESCTTASDCTPAACSDTEAGITACNDGTCETSCEPGYVACTDCSSPADCMFDGQMCPPPNTDPFQNCFDGNCSEICGAASNIFCTTDQECPLVQCPGGAAPAARCLGTGCVDAAARCCDG